jgi:hypothetical protein
MMQHLADALRTAAAAPPPTSIDLDQLIATEQRVARRRRATAVAGAALAVVALAAAVAVGPSLGRGSTANGPAGAGPGPTGPVPGEGPSANVPSDRKPVPTTPALTPEQRARADQLAAALSQALTPILSAHGDWSFTPFGFGWEAETGWAGADATLPGYPGTGLLTSARGDENKLAVLVRRAPVPTDLGCPPGFECSGQTDADGTQVWRAESYAGGQHVRQAEVDRPDGVHVAVSETAVAGQPICLTLDDLVALAHAPALTITG